jgi:hypothetical protein
MRGVEGAQASERTCAPRLHRVLGHNLVPIVDVTSTGMFALKVGGATVLLNLLGAFVYWSGSRRHALAAGER